MAEKLAGLIIWGFVAVILYSCVEDKMTAPARDAAQAVKDRKAAESMHITYEQYRLGKEKETAAYVACRMAVESMAKYGAESDWVPNGSWTINGNQMLIHAHDVRVKNMFGAAAYVVYNCNYDIGTGMASISSIEDYQ